MNDPITLVIISENGRSPVDPPDIFIYSPIKKIVAQSNVNTL
jgi:hypothetical protein